MGASRRDEGLVRAILQIGRDFDLEVVAEGVETEAQAAALRSLGCDFAQGFLYARPVPQEDLFATLARPTHLPGGTMRGLAGKPEPASLRRPQAG